MRVLLIEDDAMLGSALCRALGDAGLRVDWVRDGAEGEAAIETEAHALVLLDLGLPGRDGLDLLRELRRRGTRIPVIVVTARDRTEDLVEGLDLGADDYLAKPFEVSELLARIRAVLRRHRGHAVSTIGTSLLWLDLASREAVCQGVTAVLSQREFALLQALLERPGAVLSRSQLEEKIYGWGEEVESNAVDALIYGLRKKLGRDAIRNLRGAGWMVPRV
jgi:DNA-binding response OmpR family regulator